MDLIDDIESLFESQFNLEDHQCVSCLSLP